ncbi:hypothetical protein IX51_05205 [uncultured archaeon]|nr:hypothetical protein IX51_05205 [uncultured archaeon]
MAEVKGKLENRVAIVTGGNSGIGRGIALALAKEGASVAIGDIVDTPREGGKDTASVIRDNGGKAIFVKTDVSDEKSVENLVESAVKELGSLDIMVNNAGITLMKSALDTSGDEFLNVLSVNVKGAFLGSKYALKHMVRAQKGKIINLASNFSYNALPNLSAYVTSKTAVLGLTRALAVEYAPVGINVNAICPGATKTEFTRPFWGNKEGLSELKSRTPLMKNGEFLVKPEDLGKLAVFLASDDSDMITGEGILVDAGWSAM